MAPKKGTKLAKETPIVEETPQAPAVEETPVVPEVEAPARPKGPVHAEGSKEQQLSKLAEFLKQENARKARVANVRGTHLGGLKPVLKKGRTY